MKCQDLFFSEKIIIKKKKKIKMLFAAVVIHALRVKVLRVFTNVVE